MKQVVDATDILPGLGCVKFKNRGSRLEVDSAEVNVVQTHVCDDVEVVPEVANVGKRAPLGR